MYYLLYNYFFPLLQSTIDRTTPNMDPAAQNSIRVETCGEPVMILAIVVVKGDAKAPRFPIANATAVAIANSSGLLPFTT